MSGSALSDAAMTKDPTQYTLQVAQSLGCNPSSKNMMTCLQNKPLSEIKKVQILAREFETPPGPVVAGSFTLSEPLQTMESFPNLLSKYSPSKLDPQRWNVESNRDVILNMSSEARTLASMIRFSNYQSKANRQSYFYVFGHNSVSTHYAPLNKSVHEEEMPYVLGIPLGGANTYFHSEYTQEKK